MERAFPVLISPGVDAVTASAGSSVQGLEELWILQAKRICLLMGSYPCSTDGCRREAAC